MDEEGRPQQLPWEDWRVGDDVHTSAWMRATAPAGSAAYTGRVAWSGELGYGVRAPEPAQVEADGDHLAADDINIDLADDGIPGETHDHDHDHDHGDHH